MTHATRNWLWALLPVAVLALAGNAQAQRYDDGYYNDGPVRCESNKNRTAQCPFEGRARLVRQLSGSPCIEGDTWGQSRDGIWVTRGCRAEFVSERGRPSHGGGHGWGGNGGSGGGRGQIIGCDSNDSRLRRCNVSIRRDVRMIRQRSNTACIEGQTWGWDRDGVWVNRGCRADFEVR
ncbi:DUF3011 domain-containing protein [Stenotrophomonas sp. PS02289]|uniref:DUF3011 domain-containing protein n=1 Tax=Stenotrophomonas sp. PS02289 TaxID=2991422 RepID=UPI00249B94E6|nr:DUF3011 domain-containing protein [Stenotrophomonas sp. PS02289]